ncbi:MAG: hypothetical protein ACI9BW_002891, partial [Gammaproteobacteria bacterium]
KFRNSQRLRYSFGPCAHRKLTKVPVLDPIVILIANYSIALLFGLASYGKLSAFRVFCVTLEEYQLIPVKLVTVVAAVVTGLEVLISLGAFWQPVAQFAMFAASLLLSMYAAAIGINLVRGRRDIDCGCTGPARRQLLSGWLLLRNTGLILVALLGAAVPSERIVVAADLVLVALALIAVMAIYAAINQLMVNAPRLDALDSIMDAG